MSEIRAVAEFRSTYSSRLPRRLTAALVAGSLLVTGGGVAAVAAWSHSLRNLDYRSSNIEISWHEAGEQALAAVPNADELEFAHDAQAEIRSGRRLVDEAQRLLDSAATGPAAVALTGEARDALVASVHQATIALDRAELFDRSDPTDNITSADVWAIETMDAAVEDLAANIEQLQAEEKAEALAQAHRDAAQRAAAPAHTSTRDQNVVAADPPAPKAPAAPAQPASGDYKADMEAFLATLPGGDRMSIQWGTDACGGHYGCVRLDGSTTVIAVNDGRLAGKYALTKDVIRHESAHVHQNWAWAAAGGSGDDLEAGFNAVYGGTGLEGVERSADAVAVLLGASWVHYDSTFTAAQLETARDLLANTLSWK